MGVTLSRGPSSCASNAGDLGSFRPLLSRGRIIQQPGNDLGNVLQAPRRTRGTGTGRPRKPTACKRCGEECLSVTHARVHCETAGGSCGRP